jgi:multisubunit Na+/H+ antiporter MnhG subunit
LKFSFKKHIKLPILRQSSKFVGLAAFVSFGSLRFPVSYSNRTEHTVGVIFGLSFLVIGRFLKQGIHTRDYMIIAGFGFMIFIWANGATIIQAAYPPYGIATVSAMPLALLMIMTGLYYSAVSVAQDVTLRQSIRKNVMDMRFLEGIGTAQMEKQVQARVSDLENVMKEERMELEKKSGVQSSIQEQDIKQYLLEVLQEVEKHKLAR